MDGNRGHTPTQSHACLSNEEHIARAMLLGYHYIPRAGYYFDKVPTGTNTKRWDVETLEPLSWEQTSTRLRYVDRLDKSWWEMTDEERAGCPVVPDP
jgi:hypothetical protein